MRRKGVSAVLLIGICVFGPSITYANTGTGAGQAPTLRAQAVTLATVLQRFMASPDANPEMLKHELPTLNRLNKLNLDDPNSHATLTPLIHAIAVSVEGVALSYMLDSADDSIPSDALVKAKKWKTLHQIVGNYAFSRYLSNEIRDLIGIRADYYRSKLTEEKQRELSEAMRGIELALNGNSPAQLAEAEIPAVDASGSPAENRGQVALAVSKALDEGLKSMAMAAPNPATLSEVQVLIEELKGSPNNDRKEEIARQLITLMRQNPRDEALQMAIARGVIGLEQGLDEPAMAAVLDEMARQADAAAAEQEKWLLQRSPADPRDENLHRAAALGLAHDYDLRYDGAERDNHLKKLEQANSFENAKRKPHATPLHDPITLTALILFSGMVVYLWFFFK